uniref:G_PROTEIN_RECEP_F1_2 domain-containing protein n=1 Tax=Heterorhabditis bacteriophora TaxID=37862 RepID=A0A1I7X4Q8_HETBA
MRAVLTLAIAMERIYALWKPGDYFLLDHRKVASRIGLFAVLWGTFDVVFLITEDDIFEIRVHCVTTSSSGPLFHWYFLISTIVFGLLLAFLYFYSFVNSLTVMVILMVLIFSVLPCCLYLYDMIIGQVVFMKWGPIITIGYHCYGILSFFFYNYKHREIRSALNKFYPLKRWLNCEQTESHSKSAEAASGSQMSRQIVQNLTKFDLNDKEIISSSTKEATDLSKDEIFL